MLASLSVAVGGFPLSAIVLGIINIAIVAAILILVGLLIVWLMSMFGYPIPDNIQKIYMLVVALICLYLLVALLFGMPTFNIIRMG